MEGPLSSKHLSALVQLGGAVDNQLNSGVKNTVDESRPMPLLQGLEETHMSRDDGCRRTECGPKKLGPRLGIVTPKTRLPKSRGDMSVHSASPKSLSGKAMAVV